MKKVFGPAEHSSRLLEVESETSGKFSLCVKDERGAYHTIFIAPSDAPALALAILEAAGVEPSSPHYGLNDSPEWNVRWASHYLGRSIELTEAKTAEAKEQAELEAEALELCNAAIRQEDGAIYDSFSQIPTPDLWLAVARKAREMAKDTTNGR